LSDYIQKECKKFVKPKCKAAGQEIRRIFFLAALNIMPFLKDLLHSEKSESSLHDSSVSEPTESQGASFDYNTKEQIQ
jgi:hypothetical protein